MVPRSFSFPVFSLNKPTPPTLGELHKENWALRWLSQGNLIKKSYFFLLKKNLFFHLSFSPLDASLWVGWGGCPDWLIDCQLSHNTGHSRILKYPWQQIILETTFKIILGRVSGHPNEKILKNNLVLISSKRRTNWNNACKGTQQTVKS